MPVLFAQVMGLALAKLRMDPQMALVVIIGILFGSVINIPVKRLVREEEVPVHPFPYFGFLERWAEWQQSQRETIVAVNLGGCVIPSLVALYEIGHLLRKDGLFLLAVVVAVAINAAVCDKLAKPVKGMGIAMPAMVPPLVAAMSALLLAPDQAPPLAFVAGVLGPLLGADILHLKDIPRISTGMASIGGAGTFDGIVLSGILAAYLA